MDWLRQLYREDRPWTHEASIRYFNMWDAGPDLAQATWEWRDRGYWTVLNTGSTTIPPGYVYVTP